MAYLYFYLLIFQVAVELWLIFDLKLFRILSNFGISQALFFFNLTYHFYTSMGFDRLHKKCLTFHLPQYPLQKYVSKKRKFRLKDFLLMCKINIKRILHSTTSGAVFTWPLSKLLLNFLWPSLTLHFYSCYWLIIYCPLFS